MGTAGYCAGVPWSRMYHRATREPSVKLARSPGYIPANSACPDMMVRGLHSVTATQQQRVSHECNWRTRECTGAPFTQRREQRCEQAHGMAVQQQCSDTGTATAGRHGQQRPWETRTAHALVITAKEKVVGVVVGQCRRQEARVNVRLGQRRAVVQLLCVASCRLQRAVVWEGDTEPTTRTWPFGEQN
jgi:hypothetical protein